MRVALNDAQSGGMELAPLVYVTLVFKRYQFLFTCVKTLLGLLLGANNFIYHLSLVKKHYRDGEKHFYLGPQFNHNYVHQSNETRWVPKMQQTFFKKTCLGPML
jgi:hypothetical protein